MTHGPSVALPPQCHHLFAQKSVQVMRWQGAQPVAAAEAKPGAPTAKPLMQNMPLHMAEASGTMDVNFL